MNLSQNPKLISPVAIEKLPQFIREYYTGLTDFVDAYYEWMESTGQPFERLARMGDWVNADETLDEFLKYFQSQFMAALPLDVYPRADDYDADQTSDGVDLSTVLKHSKDLFESKGTPKSFQLLFKILYNQNASIRSPIDCESLTTKTISSTVMRLVDPTAGDDIYGLEETRITGSTSGASAIVKAINESSLGTSRVYELFVTDVEGTFVTGEDIVGPTTITLTDVSGVFRVGDVIINEAETAQGQAISFSCETGQVLLYVESGTFSNGQVVTNRDGTASGTISIAPSKIEEPLSTIITGATITGAGTGYAVGMKLPIVDATGGRASLKVSSVGGTGNITGIRIVDVGANFTSPTVNLTGLGDGNATVTLTTGVLYTKTHTHYIVEQTPLYTYVVRVAKSIAEWRPLVKKAIHPAGMHVKGLFPIDVCVDAEIQTFETVDYPNGYRPVLDQYSGYKLADVTDVAGYLEHPRGSGWVGIPEYIMDVTALTGLAGPTPYKSLFPIGASITSSSGGTAKVATWGFATVYLTNPTESSSSSNSSSSSSPSSDSTDNSSSSLSSSSSSTEAEETSSSSSSLSSQSSSSSSSSSESSSSQSSDATSASESSSSSEDLSSLSTESGSSASSSSSPSSSSSITSGDSSQSSSSSSGTDSSNSSSSSSSSSESSDSSASSESSSYSSSSETSSSESSSSDSSESSVSSSSSTEALDTSSTSDDDNFLWGENVYQGTSYADSLANPGYGKLTAKVVNDSWDTTDLDALKIKIRNIRGEFDLSKTLINESGQEYHIVRVDFHLGINTITGLFSIGDTVELDDNTLRTAEILVPDGDVRWDDFLVGRFCQATEYTNQECGSTLTQTDIGLSSSSSSSTSGDSSSSSSSTEASETSSESSSSTEASETSSSSSESSSSQSSD